mmetsp:Transcript_29692/g.95736  ORF Transcript_29692/g.95736 Transcript_29692/m.95736 type:complete len:219 (-) Transcript_29692:118-774(-)
MLGALGDGDRDDALRGHHAPGERRRPKVAAPRVRLLLRRAPLVRVAPVFDGVLRVCRGVVLDPEEAPPRVQRLALQRLLRPLLALYPLQRPGLRRLRFDAPTPLDGRRRCCGRQAPTDRPKTRTLPGDPRPLLDRPDGKSPPAVPPAATHLRALRRRRRLPLAHRFPQRPRLRRHRPGHGRVGRLLRHQKGTPRPRRTEPVVVVRGNKGQCESERRRR